MSRSISRSRSILKNINNKEKPVIKKVDDSQEDKTNDVQIILSRKTPFSTENRSNK